MKNACWKRLFAVILTLMLIASLMPAAFASDASGESSEGEPPVDAAPACTCGAAEDAAHAEGCPLYGASEPEDTSGESGDGEPSVDTALTCTCNAAEDAAHAEGCPLYGTSEPEDAVSKVQAMINALPEASMVTEENVDEVKAQLEAIDAAKLSLTDEQMDALDIQKYMAVAAALGAVYDAMTLDEVVVAKIGNQTYNTIAAAITAAGTNATTIDLVSSVSENVVVPAGVNITLNIVEGVTLTNNGGDTITNNGMLTVTGAGTVNNMSNGKTALCNNGTAYLNGGSFVRNDTAGNSYYTVVNHGTMTIAGAAISNDNTLASCLENGWYNASDVTGTAMLTVVSGTISGGLNAVKNDNASKLEVKGGTITNSSQYAIMNYGITTVSGGEISCTAAGKGTSSSEAAIYNHNSVDTGDTAKLTVTGGTISGMNHGIYNYSGNVTISGNAEINAATYALYSAGSAMVSDNAVLNGGSSGISSSGSDLTITGGTITGTKYYGITLSGSDVTISGGSLVSNSDKYYVVYARNSSDVTITGGTFGTDESNNKATVYATGNSGVIISGGVFQGATSNIKVGSSGRNTVSISDGTYSNDVSEYVVAGNKAIAKGDGTYYIGVDTSKAVAEVNGYGYTTVDAAIKEAENGGTVKLLKDAADITIPKGYTVTLDLNGCTVSSASDHAITNNGSLTVTGTGTVDGGSTSGKGALYNAPGATAALNGGTFTGSKWYVIKNLGTMTINGATVEQKDSGSSGIDNGYYGNSANDCGVTYPSEATVTLTIQSGSFSGGMNTVKNDDFGVLAIYGGTYANTSGPTILNWNVATITGGTFTVNDTASSVVANGHLDETADKGQLTITGGTFIAANNGQGMLLGYGSGSTTGGKLEISGGTFKGVLEVDSNYPYTPVVSGGTFSNPVDEDYCATGYAPTDMDANGNYTVCNHPSVTAVAAQDATCGKAGNIAYWYCADCGRYFSDSSYTQEVAKTDLVIPATGKHTYDGYSCDSTGHWQVCTVCSTVTDVQAHSFASTVCDDNVTRQICTVCGSAKLSLSFDPNGGRRAPAAQAVITSPDSYSGIIVISAAKPSRFGYFFQGWSTSTSGNVQYRPGDSITITQDTTLYAVWARPTDSPRTGDTSNLGLWIAVAGVSVLAIGAAAFIIFKKKGGNK